MFSKLIALVLLGAVITLACEVWYQSRVIAQQQSVIQGCFFGVQ